MNGEYQTIAAALASLPTELVEDIIITVEIDPVGYTEPDLEADIADFVLNGYSLEIQANFYSAVTVYLDGEIEYRIDNEQNVETIHNVIAGELLARRSLDEGSVTAPKDYFLKNHLGSTVATVDEAGNVSGDVLDYYAYGKQVRVISYAGSDVTETFTGKELDRFDDDIAFNADGEGLYYFPARYYDPEIGMFIGVDPVRQFWNSYSYTGGNPVNLIDPTGMAAWETTNDWTDEQIQGYQTYAADFISSYTEEIDCADLALTALINYASENNLPLNLRYYDKGWKSYDASSDAFTNVAQYLNTVRINMGALGVIDNTSPLALSNAAAGDLIMSKWSSTLGHTRIISSIAASGTDYNVTWYQGNLPAAVPEQRQSLYSNIGSVYGNSPRRWNFSQW
jgi:RHS repeat-associated protein